MMKLHLILLLVFLQAFAIHCYTLNNIQRNVWSDFDAEPTDAFLAKLLHVENLFQEDNQPMNVMSSINDGQTHPLQKRGRQCLWKVCSWALDKRSVPSNPGNSL